MKVDLVTIFPKVVLDTGEQEKQKRARDHGTMSEIHYLGAHITSYKSLVSQSSGHKHEVVECIKETHQNIVDSDRQPFDDYIVVVDENIEWDFMDPPNPPSVDLITYFLNLKGDASVGLDFGKIILSQSRYEYPEHTYVNNRRVFWGNHSPWVLPIKQWRQVRISLTQKEEGSLANALHNLHNNQARLHEKLTTAIDLFNQSCRISLFHRNVALVLIVSAFEALFNIPATISRKKLTLAYIMQVYLGFDEDVANQAETLYNLRNTVVHGEIAAEKRQISSGQYYSHYEIAKSLFEASLGFVLEQYGELDINPRDKSIVKKHLLDLIASNKKKVEKAIELLKRFARSTQDYPEKESCLGEFLETLSVLNPDDISAKELLFPYLKAVFLIVRKEIQVEKDCAKQTTGGIHTRSGIMARIPYYNKIVRIIQEMENIICRSQSKFKKRDRTQLDIQIDDLLQVTNDMEGLGHGLRGTGYELGEFVSKSFGATRAFRRLRNSSN